MADTAFTKFKVKEMKVGNGLYIRLTTGVKVGVGITMLSNEKGLCGSGKVLDKKRCNQTLLSLTLAHI